VRGGGEGEEGPQGEEEGPPKGFEKEEKGSLSSFSRVHREGGALSPP